MDERRSLTIDERAELERLRAEVTRLRSKVPPDRKVPPGTAAGPGRQRWRTIVAVVLIVLGSVLAPVAGVAVWARNQVTDTDRYVATVAPLASDPAIQQAITNQITSRIFTYIDVQELTTQAVDALAQRGLPPRVSDGLEALSGPIANGVQGFAHDRIGEVVQSQTFADAWVQANRAAHEALVRALTGEGDGAITVQGDTVSINLGPFVQTVKERLLASGFTLAERIPPVEASFVLLESEQVARTQTAFNLLNALGDWLPWIVLALLGLGVYVARSHRRALLGAGLGVAAGMFFLALGLAVSRSVYLDGMPAEVLPHDAAAVLYDTMVRFLRAGLRTILVLGLVVAAGAFLTGPSVTAVRTRQGLTGAIAWLRGGAEGMGLRTGPVGTWVDANKRLLQIVAVTVTALVLVFWDRPTGQVVIGLALALLAVLAIIEFLARPRRSGAAPA